MAQFNPESGERTFRAGEDLSIGRIVALDTSTENQVLLADSATDPIVGVAIGFGKDGLANDAVRVQKGGFSTKLIMSGSCGIGDKITATTNGKGVVTTTDKDFVVGRALQAAGADGDVIEVALIMGFLSI